MAGDVCEFCGRERWQGDRFCAQCGVGFDPSGDEPERADLGGEASVVGRPAGSTSSASKRRTGAFTVAVAVAVGALLVGGLYLTSSSDDSSAIEDAQEELPSPVSEQPEPTIDATAADTTAADPTPRPERAGEPVDRTRATFLAELFGVHDPGAKWLLLGQQPGDTVAYDLDTGESHAPRSGLGPPIHNVLLHDGVVASSFGPESGLTSSFLPWDADQPPVELSGSYVGAFVDRDMGRVLVALAPEPEPALHVIAAESGERRELPLELSLVNNGVTSLRFDTGLAGAMQAPALLSEVGESVWAWTWARGWEQIADGDVQHTGQEFIVVRACPAPEQCDFSVVNFEGEIVVDALPWLGAAFQSLSPDGATLLSVRQISTHTQDTSGDFAFRLTDVDSGAVNFDGVTVGEPHFAWSPNSRYLVVTGHERTTVLDADQASIIGSFDTGRVRDSGLTFTDEFIPRVAPAD